MKSIANYGIRHDRMNITNADFLKMPVPIPALEEQQKIAAFLSTIDRQINLATQQLDRMQTFKKGLLQQMFV
jgi:type I restriction enzyme S subunit